MNDPARMLPDCECRNRTRANVVQSHVCQPADTSQCFCAALTRLFAVGQPRCFSSFTPVRRIRQPREEGRAGLEPARCRLTGDRSAAELPTQSFVCSKSASRESNPPDRGGNPAPLPLGQRHVVLFLLLFLFALALHDFRGRPTAKRKPWDSNPQRTRARTCFRDRLLIQPDDFLLVEGRELRGEGRVRLSSCLRRFQAAVAGFEPAIISLTGSCLTVWPHRNVCCGFCRSQDGRI